MEQKVVWLFDNEEIFYSLVGPLNTNIKMLEQEIDDTINDFIYNGKIALTTKDGNNDELLKKFLTVYTELFLMKVNLEIRDLSYILNILKNNLVSISQIYEFYQKNIVILNTYEGRKISPKTLMQYKLLTVMQENQIVFAHGSAGTGKTYLAMAFATNALKKNLIKKIIITRPAVEAGEKLGFLPGDLKEKVDPYLIPIYDALDSFLGKENVAKFVEKGIIEIAPLAYMRGRTLDNAYIILDEAQNTTVNQMKMFLTRLGFNSKMFITGDITQVDLPKYQSSGLINAISILNNIDGVKIVEFTKNDVMRNPIVAKIIEKYEESEIF